MLEHLNSSPTPPTRAVLLGATSFVGRHASAALASRGVDVLGLGSKDLNLLDPDAAERLAERLNPSDCLVVISAIAPCKTVEDLAANTRMMANVCQALDKSPVDHVVYISSDAVYDDDANPIDERTPTTPQSLHGLMHVVREGMLSNTVAGPLAILRPSLLYGADDPHNGYGPNRFRRLVSAGEPIVLFGQGEERRDHVYIGDVAELIASVVLHRSQGTLNIATGQVASFHDIAEKVSALHGATGDIETTPRQGPMPHGGYRSFLISDCRKAFPKFQYKDLDAGLAYVHRQLAEDQ